jgi:hypothetical protein
VFATDDATGRLRASWLVKERLRALLATGSLADAAAAKDPAADPGPTGSSAGNEQALADGLPVWTEIEVLIVTGATTAKSEATTPRSTH